MKILAILYPGGEIAKNNPGLLGCAENALGLRDFLEKQGHEFVVLTDKEHELDEHLSTTDTDHYSFLARLHHERTNLEGTHATTHSNCWCWF